jgi:hypothetical protein
MMVPNHPLHVQVLNEDRRSGLGVSLRDFEVKVSSLPTHLQVRLGDLDVGLSPSLRPLHAARSAPLLRAEFPLRGAEVPWIVYGLAIRVGKKRLETNVNPDRWFCVDWRFDLDFARNDDEPLVDSLDQVAGLRCAFKRSMQLDLDGLAEFGGDAESAVGQPGVFAGAPLAEVDGVPVEEVLEAREAAMLAEFLSGKHGFHGFVDSVGEALDGGLRDELTATATEAGAEVVPPEELAGFGIVGLDGFQHFVIEVTRCGEAGIQFGCLLRGWEESVLESTHPNDLLLV